MVEESANSVNRLSRQSTTQSIGQASTQTPQKVTVVPTSVYNWSTTDVQKWLRRHCTECFPLYADKFLQHEINGRNLVRINDNSLLRLGITNVEHREAIWRQILKLRLKADIIEIRDYLSANDQIISLIDTSRKVVNGQLNNN